MPVATEATPPDALPPAMNAGRAPFDGGAPSADPNSSPAGAGGAAVLTETAPSDALPPAMNVGRVPFSTEERPQLIWLPPWLATGTLPRSSQRGSRTPPRLSAISCRISSQIANDFGGPLINCCVPP